MSKQTGTRLWIDITDLVEYLERHSRPSGIQRVSFEICSGLMRWDSGKERVKLVARRRGPHDLVTIDWTDLQHAYSAIVEQASTQKQDRGRREIRVESGKVIPSTAPAIIREILGLQVQVFAQLLTVPAALASAAKGAFHWTPLSLERKNARERSGFQRRKQSRFESELLRHEAKPGDCLLVLGSPWEHRDYVDTVRWIRDDLRMRFSLLIHDLIPVRRPEWCDKGVIVTFAEWHRAVLPLADQIFANSNFTASDITRWLCENGFELPRPVQRVPFGTGLSAAQTNEVVFTLGRLPQGPFVLFVSTLEARKNHALLVRIWRRLLAELSFNDVPILVFAGSAGWLVNDLLQQLENADWLGGKIQWISQPNDAELAALYRQCLFTVFPSFYEGWGLPVSESLAFGTPCLASNTTSLPESGGTSAQYFDPNRFEDAYCAVKRLIEAPEELKAWRERIAVDFLAVSWDESASVIMNTLSELEETRP